MTIETTKGIFDLIFTDHLKYDHAERKENYRKYFYSLGEQRGITLHNLNGNIFQYYLIDINA